jgi:hypothetical protein
MCVSTREGLETTEAAVQRTVDALKSRSDTLLSGNVADRGSERTGSAYYEAWPLA